MAIAATVIGKDKRGGILTAYITLVFSGNYVNPGGEVLDFNTLVGYTSRQPKGVQISGKAGFIYQYDGANKKVQVRINDAGGANAPMAEMANGAYAAGVTGDTVTAEVFWTI